MTLDQALRLIGMLTDTITAQEIEIARLTGAIATTDVADEPDGSRP